MHSHIGVASKMHYSLEVCLIYLNEIFSNMSGAGNFLTQIIIFYEKEQAAQLVLDKVKARTSSRMEFFVKGILI